MKRLLKHVLHRVVAREEVPKLELGLSALGPSNPFKIRPGYLQRAAPMYFEDVVNGVVYQPDVYLLAGFLSKLVRARYLVDLGCGYAQKLIQTAREHSLIPIGFDYGQNLTHCRESYPEGQWIEVDFEDPNPDLLSPDILQHSIIICSDMIEHLQDPSKLMFLLRDWLRTAHFALLSTPEREVRWGIEHNGPPPNPAHVREWSAQELDAYLNANGLNVRFIGLTRSKNTAYSMWTQLVVLGPPT